jgi:hypothetical protein
MRGKTNPKNAKMENRGYNGSAMVKVWWWKDKKLAVALRRIWGRPDRLGHPHGWKARADEPHSTMSGVPRLCLIGFV